LKIEKFQAHIVSLRHDMNNLFTKKKQIENIKLQRALEQQLTSAQDEKVKLQTALKNEDIKRVALHHSDADLEATIASINDQLAKLKGANPQQADEHERQDLDEESEADKLSDNVADQAAGEEGAVDSPDV